MFDYTTEVFDPEATAAREQDATSVSGAPDESLHTYAVVDAGRIFGWRERLAHYAPAQATCLFEKADGDGDGARLGDVAPWLVRLEAGSALARDLLAHTQDNPGPSELLQHEATIFITSKLTFDEMRRHLRRYTQVPDEEGARFFFRFYDPIALPTLMHVLTPEESAAFVHPFVTLFSITTLYDESWLLHRFDTRMSDESPPRRIITMDKPKRDRLQSVAFQRTAWTISKEAGHAPHVAAEFEAVALPLMFCAYSNPERLLELFALHRSLPPQGQQDLIRAAQSGRYSPRHLGLAIANHYSLTYPDGATQ